MKSEIIRIIANKFIMAYGSRDTAELFCRREQRKWVPQSDESIFWLALADTIETLENKT